MLEGLCGSESVRKILLFLFIHEQCYGSQLQKLLKTPLTPIQKALLRLEKGGVLSSLYEGKIRIYRFNLSYPLLAELQQLLKKAYMLQEKGLLDFWERLTTVKNFAVEAQTWRGKGEVFVKKEGENVLIFTEKGKWMGSRLAFTNTHRWTLDEAKGVISLEQLKQGSRIIFRFQLEGSQELLFTQGRLFSQIVFDGRTLRLTRRAITEAVDYFYS